MNPQFVLRGVWLSAFALFTGAVVGWVSATPRLTSGANFAVNPRPGAVPFDRIIPGDSIDDAASATSDHDPFRLTREPSAVPYDAGGEVVAASAPAPPKPPLALSGIVGPPWVAVLEGVPGRTGSVLAKAGDTLARPPLALVVVHRIWRDTVVVVGTDTTWTLTVYHPWR
jgi:hypothetical protein